MSASPAGETPGRTPGRTPNGTAPPIIRRPRNADPLVRPKDRQRRRPQPQPLNGSFNHPPSALRSPGYAQMQAKPQHTGRPTPPFARPSPTPLPSDENARSGFSSQPVTPFKDYPLIMTKRALMEGFRHHVARFSSKRNIDPRNTEEFVRPIRLHRRDPRAPPAGGSGVKSEDQAMGGMEGPDDKDRAWEEALKAEKDAAREAEMALVAPAVNTGGQKKLGANMKKTEQIYRNDQTDEQKARSKLRYEEALPWHLEDFDNKSTWVGSYEAALSENYVMMVQGSDGAFRMIPLEKWYKFTQKNLFKTLSIDEAESRYNKKVKEPRWFMDSEESRKKRQSEQENKKASSGLFLGKWEKGGGGSGVAAPITKQENPDADDLDFTEDRFADDEENMLFEEDDETKEAEERIKRDQLQANVFDLKEEKEYDKQENMEKKEKEVEKKLGKGVKKALKRREKNYVYDSDSTDNPYSSGSESEDTETERLKEEERKKAEAEAEAEGNKLTPEKEKSSKHKPSSGSSSRGTNTPSHRSSKHPDSSLHKSSSTISLKRPGSPLNSEASGNESSRKKHKKKHPLTTSSQIPLQPPSRPGSPPISVPSSSALQASQSNKSRQTSSSVLPSKRPHAGRASGTDTEGGAGSGRDMSDGTRKRIKLKLGMPSKNGTPQGSRAGSPEVVADGSVAGLPASSLPAADSKTINAPATSPSPPPPSQSSTTNALPFPTPAELRSRVPPEGITMRDLLAFFPGRIVDEERKQRFKKLVRQNASYDKEKQLLVPMGGTGKGP